MNTRWLIRGLLAASVGACGTLPVDRALSGAGLGAGTGAAIGAAGALTARNRS